ncbi:hypothetical protein [Dyadobacter sp. Leaf189]|uniref:hypothetical protein n=1 Tax=Dyadobacter sp. Leaf189 TaxID=1736295 RepID=UPI0006FEB5E5|nr:hypothetical protein [Dyadobacter sp. Leaf189]KQS28150.1 hypothetical protein ASG33_17350 [Dyadobacter sp. Leaf189]
MKNLKFLAAAVAAITILSFQAKAQSIVDPGISVHNYKHPNKAAAAKANRKNTVEVANLKTVERAGKYQRSKYMSTTPKYAPRPATMVVMREYKVEGVQLNPLTSPRNYKTQNVLAPVRDTVQMADNVNSADGSTYPTVD